MSSGQVAFLVGLGVISAFFGAVRISFLIPVLEYVDQGPHVFDESHLAVAVAQIVASLGIMPTLQGLFLVAAPLVPLVVAAMFLAVPTILVEPVLRARVLCIGRADSRHRSGVSRLGVLLGQRLALTAFRGEMGDKEVN